MYFECSFVNMFINYNSPLSLSCDVSFSLLHVWCQLGFVVCVVSAWVWQEHADGVCVDRRSGGAGVGEVSRTSLPALRLRRVRLHRPQDITCARLPTTLWTQHSAPSLR